MTNQPDPLKVARELDDFNSRLDRQAAAAIRSLHQSEREGWRYADELEQERQRLHALNQELLEELKGASNYIDHLGGDSKLYREAIAKAEGGKQ